MELPKASWIVTLRNDDLSLILADDGEAVATIAFPATMGKKVIADLEAALKGRKVEGDSVMEAGLYLGSYAPGGSEMKLNDGLEISVLPRYEGVDEDGHEVIDDRPTFVLVDRKKGQWPVMAKMNAAAAQKLLDDVRKALK